MILWIFNARPMDALLAKIVTSLKCLVTAIAVAVPLSACQSVSKVAPHFQGKQGFLPVQSYRLVTVRPLLKQPSSPLTKDSLKKHEEAMGKQGYSLIGVAALRGEQESLDDLRRFSASVGADLVEGRVKVIGSIAKSYIGVSSFTPGTTATSQGTMVFSTPGVGTTYGSSSTTTNIPAQTTYAPVRYDVPITDQSYLFWLSPKGLLDVWLEFIRRYYPRYSTEEAKFAAAVFAQTWNLHLPSNLQPTKPVPKLSREALARLRTQWHPRAVLWNTWADAARF